MEQYGYPTKLIIDTDMGWDDVLAIMLLMKDPNFDIIGITVTGCGETHLEDGVKIAQGLLKLGNIDAPVSAGADVPSQYNHQFPPSFRKDMDGLCGLRDKLPKVTDAPDPRPAWEFINDQLASQEYQITILSLGGLTNIARMMDEYSDAVLENIERLVIMGGAVNVDGNVAALNNSNPKWDQGPVYASNHYAEWNIFLDAKAAQRVLKSDIPITMVPLDACDYVLLEKDYADLVYAPDPVAQLTKEMIIQKTGAYKENLPLPIFDPLAALVMTNEPSDCKVSMLRLDVVTTDSEDDNTCGQTFAVKDEAMRPVRVVSGTSQYEFKKIFSEMINSPLTPPKDEIIRKNAGILLFDQCEVLDFAGVFESLAAARNSDQSAVFNVFTIGMDKKPKTLNAGPPPKGKESSFALTPDYLLGEHPPLDVLLVVGGQGIDALMDKEKTDPALLEWLKSTSNGCEYVAGFCSGVLLLAQAGLLNNLEVTTHHTRFNQLEEMSKAGKMGLKVVDTRNGRNFIHVPSSKFMTSGGVHCGIALAVYITGLYQGDEKKQELAHDVMEYTIPRGLPETPKGFPEPRHMNPEEFILGFSHMNVIMRDLQMMEEATEFYRRVLGFRQAWSLWLPPEASKHFAHDAGLDDCKVMVRFLIHPNAQVHIELMMYEYPKGDPEVKYKRTNDVGGIRHIAMEVTDAVAVYNFMKNQDGVKLLSDEPPVKLSPDPQTFFYWLDPYGVQWEMEEARPMARVICGIVG
ncbi:MAG: hypothetical protein GY765_06280 [bacterium]|nr:hypothetical protein [bacterium]